MNTLTLNNDVYETPSRWNEISAAHLLKVADMSQDVQNLHEFLIKLWLHILDFKVLIAPEEIVEDQTCFYIWSKVDEFKLFNIGPEIASNYYHTIKDKTYLISAQDLQFAAGHLKWMFTEKYNGQDLVENTFILNSCLTKNKIKEFRFAKTNYCGPDNELTNLLFGEYIFAETYFTRYQETKNPEWMNKFFAVLYRPLKSKKEIQSKDYDGDKRIAFNAAAVIRNADRLENMHENYKTACLLFYDGCRNYLSQKFPLTFAGGSGKKIDTFVAMSELVVTLKNETGDNIDNIRNMLLYDALLMLERIGEKVQDKKIKGKRISR